MNVAAETGPTLLQVAPAMFDSVWPHCEALMRRGLAIAPELHNRETRGRIADGTLQSWMITESEPARLLAVFFTDINVEADGSKWVCVHALAGRQMWRWARKLSDGMDKFARAEGCQSIRFAGKRGWGRVLREYRVIGGHGFGSLIFERAVA